MKQWLMLRSESERRLLLIAIFLLTLVFIWYGILTPLNNQIARSRIQINTQRHQLDWMTQQTQRLGTPVGRRVKKEKLNEAINAAVASLALPRPDTTLDERGVTLSFEQISYATLLRWLELLSKEHGIQVVAISIVADTGPAGSIRVPQLTLR